MIIFGRHFLLSSLGAKVKGDGRTDQGLCLIVTSWSVKRNSLHWEIADFWVTTPWPYGSDKLREFALSGNKPRRPK
jgi:hypothetical protein